MAALSSGCSRVFSQRFLIRGLRCIAVEASPAAPAPGTSQAPVAQTSPALVLALVAGVAAAAASKQPVSCDEQSPVLSGARLNRAFHAGRVHPLLERHLPRAVAGLSDAPKAPAQAEPLRVLVPLCGKCMDMVVLCEQGHSVVGVDGLASQVLELRSEQRRRLKGSKKPAVMSLSSTGWTDGVCFEAAEDFKGSRSRSVFKMGEKGLGYYTDSPQVWRGKVSSYSGEFMPLDIIQGDLLEDVTPELISVATFAKQGSFDLVYDRVCTAALPPDDRQRYVELLWNLLRPGGRILMIACDFEHPSGNADADAISKSRAPPFFSCTLAELRSLFPAGQWRVEVLEQVDTKSESGAGVHSDVVLITKRDGSGSDGTGRGRAMLAVAASIGVVALSAVTVSRFGLA